MAKKPIGMDRNLTSSSQVQPLTAIGEPLLDGEEVDVDLDDEDNADWLQKARHLRRLRELEEWARNVTRPLGDPAQYPRPWTTCLNDPLAARVFIVGLNQATAFHADRFTHDDFVAALFNRGPTACDLYRRARAPKGSSPTRQNLDRLTDALADEGVTGILETNVVCYSTPRGDDLELPQHQQGRARGREIFAGLLRLIPPKLIIVHGAEAARLLAEVPQEEAVATLRIPTLTPRHGQAELDFASIARDARSMLAREA